MFNFTILWKEIFFIFCYFSQEAGFIWGCWWWKIVMIPDYSVSLLLKLGVRRKPWNLPQCLKDCQLQRHFYQRLDSYKTLDKISIKWLVHSTKCQHWIQKTLLQDVVVLNIFIWGHFKIFTFKIIPAGKGELDTCPLSFIPTQTLSKNYIYYVY